MDEHSLSAGGCRATQLLRFVVDDDRVRGSNIRELAEIIDADDGEPAGRTLDFLGQEMLREANTIGSKSSDVDLARDVIALKSDIDRLKEQVANLE